jgi:pSer/pThr/pTyr-binding forkhead associated (FHA) protein
MATIVFLHDNVAIQTYPIGPQGLRFGRDSACEVFIDDKLVSSEHALIDAVAQTGPSDQAQYYITDLNSTNQTFVNGEAVERQKLNHNDTIRIGRHTFKFIEETAAGAEKTLKLHKSWIPGVYYTKDES